MLWNTVHQTIDRFDGSARLPNRLTAPSKYVRFIRVYLHWNKKSSARDRAHTEIIDRECVARARTRTNRTVLC